MMDMDLVRLTPEGRIMCIDRGGSLAEIPFTTGQNCDQFCLRLHELRAFRNSVQHARSGDYLLRPDRTCNTLVGDS